MTFTLTFSKDLHPLTINGAEASIKVDADSRTEAIYHKDTVDYCNLHECTVRRVI